MKSKRPKQIRRALATTEKRAHTRSKGLLSAHFVFKSIYHIFLFYFYFYFISFHFIPLSLILSTQSVIRLFYIDSIAMCISVVKCFVCARDSQQFTTAIYLNKRSRLHFIRYIYMNVYVSVSALHSTDH